MTDAAQRRTRSFGGCITCRQRRIKCDELRPQCTLCLKAGVACEGYEAKLRFVFHDPRLTGRRANSAKPLKDGDDSNSRQQLFTEDDRLATSLALISSVKRLGVDAIIEQLELQPYGSLPGPFGVFVLEQESPIGLDIDLSISTSDGLPSEVFDEEIDRFALYQDRSPPELVSVTDLADLCNVPVPPSRTSTREPALDTYDNQGNGLGFGSLEGFALPNPFLGSTGTGVLTINTPISSDPYVGVDEECMSVIPSSSSFLLNHYKLQMGKLFSPIRVRKPIWSVLHLPSAMATFSQLTVFGEASHAKSALFYGLLAVSAFNLDKISTESASSYWWAVGERLSQKAKQELQQACNLELDGPKKSKYKDILMAVLNMITIAVVNAQQEEARSYLLNAELFMCVRSAQKTHHSRKAKMLHQIFLFLRIIEESTYIYPSNWQPEQTPSSTELFPSMRFPSLRTHSLGQGRDIDALCGGNIEHSLLGQPCCTHKFETVPLFSQVYGIPESLFSLISRITALANEVSTGGALHATNALPPHLLEVSEALEKEVCGWTNETGDAGTNPPPDENSLPESQFYMPHFISAIHSATVILFYRRVYKLNPLLLQAQVETVIDHLIRTEVEKVNSAVVNTAIVWPGFIAAAEALSPALKEKCESWLRGCAASGGMRNFDLAADVARKVWKERERSGDVAFSWVDLVREQRIALVLT